MMSERAEKMICFEEDQSQSMKLFDSSKENRNFYSLLQKSNVSLHPHKYHSSKTRDFMSRNIILNQWKCVSIFISSNMVSKSIVKINQNKCNSSSILISSQFFLIWTMSYLIFKNGLFLVIQNSKI
jgi:hypothetical protein